MKFRASCERISAPEIILSPDWACALALAINELGTNASKYGSLSKVGEVLEIRWSILAKGELDTYSAFRLCWTESRGPAVQEPRRQGYGTLMIGGTLRNAFDGSAVLTFNPAGLTCDIFAPFSPKLGIEDSSD